MNKYGNKAYVVDGITFASIKEGRRYQELKLMQRGGEITELQTQVPFQLIPAFVCNSKRYRPTMYIADFTYRDKDGRYIVEDVKGSKDTLTKEYMIKKKLMAWIHGYEIKEVYS